jgi:tetratricopeptide (TPR) repeat protein
VLDGFNIHIDIGEQSGDEEHAREHDGEHASTPLVTFYRVLVANLTGQSRVLITSRYPPVDAVDIPTLFPLVHEESLGEMSRAHMVRFLLRDATIRGRYRNGDLKLEVLHTLYTILNGSPRFLLQIRQALRDMPPVVLHDALSSCIPFSPMDSSLPTKVQQVREQFCLDTFVQYLYDKLEPESQQALSCAAVYPVPVPMAGLVAVTGIPNDGLTPMVRQWQDLELIVPIAAAGYKRYTPSTSNGDVLWVVVAHIRGWLLDTSRLSLQEAHAARSAAGQFLYRQVTDTVAPLSEELRDEWLIHAYRLYSAAGDYAQAREVVGYLSHRYRQCGYYTELELLNQAVLDYEQHPAPMVWIGRVQSELGNVATARAWFEAALAQAQEESPDAPRYPGEAARAWYELGRMALQQGKELTARQAFEHALEQYQQAELDAGEAAAWHQLALLEMNQGNDSAAFEKFCVALRKEQATGNREAEARLFYELGVLAAKQGDIEVGLRLSTLSLLILRGIGHEDQQNIEAGVNALMIHLGYSQEQFAGLVQVVEQAYREDGGWGVFQG